MNDTEEDKNRRQATRVCFHFLYFWSIGSRLATTSC